MASTSMAMQQAQPEVPWGCKHTAQVPPPPPATCPPARVAPGTPAGLHSACLEFGQIGRCFSVQSHASENVD